MTNLNEAAFRLKILADLYKASIPNEAPFVAHAPQNMAFQELNAKTPDVDLASAYDLYQNLLTKNVWDNPETMNVGGLLAKQLDQNDLTSRAEILLEHMEVAFLNVLFEALEDANFQNVKMSANAKSYFLSAEYKGVKVDFQVDGEPGEIYFYKAIYEAKRLIDENADTLLARGESVYFFEDMDSYLIFSRKNENGLNDYVWDFSAGFLSSENYQSYVDAYRTYKSNNLYLLPGDIACGDVSQYRWTPDTKPQLCMNTIIDNHNYSFATSEHGALIANDLNEFSLARIQDANDISAKEKLIYIGRHFSNQATQNLSDVEYQNLMSYAVEDLLSKVEVEDVMRFVVLPALFSDNSSAAAFAKKEAGLIGLAALMSLPQDQWASYELHPVLCFLDFSREAVVQKDKQNYEIIKNVSLDIMDKEPVVDFLLEIVDSSDESHLAGYKDMASGMLTFIYKNTDDKALQQKILYRDDS